MSTAPIMTMKGLREAQSRGTADDYDHAAILASARQAYGHVPGITDAECLTRAYSNMRHAMAERNALASTNACQAQEIARLHRRVADLEARNPIPEPQGV